MMIGIKDAIYQSGISSEAREMGGEGRTKGYEQRRDVGRVNRVRNARVVYFENLHFL